jgi:membrane protease YdiL (CAAX protease family)
MIATIALAALVAWLLLAEPLLGRAAHRRLLAALDDGDADARRRFYLSWTWQGWSLVLITLLLTLGLCGWTPAQLGLRLPQLTTQLPLGFVAGVCMAMLAGALTGVVMARKSSSTHTAKAPSRVAGGDKVLRMLPHTRRERRAFAALAITAGLGEELVWRGFGLGALQLWLPHASAALLIVLLAAGFGWAHLYQGLVGMLATGLIGALMAGLYLATGSLLLPMLLHTLLDLRALLIPTTASATTGSTA